MTMRKGISSTILLFALFLTACGGGGFAAAPPEILQPPAAAAEPALSIASTKTFRFIWADVSDATYYRLLENPDGSSGFVQVGDDIPQGIESVDHVVPLYARSNAQYILESCNAAGCNSSDSVAIGGTLVDAIGYLKASNSEQGDRFGLSVSLSADGRTLAVGATREDSGAGGDEDNNFATESGAAYVFVREGSVWTQQTYLKASNLMSEAFFGARVSISADGNTLAVGAPGENSGATGINDFDNNAEAIRSGAVYLFGRRQGGWSQQAYIKASNTGASDRFGASISLSGDGRSLAVGAPYETSAATGINGDQVDNSTLQAGAVYLFRRDDAGWAQRAYIKASNTGFQDRFGGSVALSDDGDTLAVAAPLERSGATGIDADQADNSALSTGAVYVYTRDDGDWSQQSYIKASNSEAGDQFGAGLSLAADGNTLAVGAPFENSGAAGVDGDHGDNSVSAAGAVYVFARQSNIWSQRTYLKANNPEVGDFFGSSVDLSADGSTLAVSSYWEGSGSIGIDGVDFDSSAPRAGAATVFKLSGSVWHQLAYVKASNTDTDDHFGFVGLSVSGDGNTLTVGAIGEASNAIGINGDQSDNSAPESGAVYVY